MSAAERNGVWVSSHFRLSEFESPDTGEVMVDPLLVYCLEVVRLCWGWPLHVSSGYRTPEHNRAVGGLVNSRHLAGQAVDIPLRDVTAALGEGSSPEIAERGWIPRPELSRFVRIVRGAGVGRVQVVDEQDHVHLEVD